LLNPRRLAFELLHAARVRDGLLRHQREFARNERAPIGDLQLLQARRLAALLEHCARSVPYYRELLRDRPIPTEGDAVFELLRSLPPQDKETIRAQPEAFVAAALPIARRLASDTGGSTGEVLRFFLDAASRDARAAATHRFYRWCGIHPTDRHAMLWGAAFDAPNQHGIRQKARHALHPLLFLSSFRLDDSTLCEYLDALVRFRPRLLTSYPSPLLALCQAMPAGYALRDLRAVICSAEQLLPTQRERIEAAFGLPVFDRYGSREFGNLAQECESHTGLHVAVDRARIEIVDSHGNNLGPNESGEILVTDLDNFVQPFVRYRTGDIGRWLDGACACGRTLPRIGAIEGRSFDLVQTGSGRRIAGTFWTLLLRRVSPRISHFQVVQEGPTQVTVRLRTLDQAPLLAAERDLLTRQVHAVASELEISVDMESAFEATRSGKHRVVINRWLCQVEHDGVSRPSEP
jgi:phenylacetate-CoA ligase